jgi:F420-dependent oxidoreductase-like protein
MRFSIWPSPNASWQDTLELCKYAESTGWDGMYYADHFMPMAGDLSTPTNECWTTLAGIAAAVPRIRIGALVSGNTYRHPAVLAKMAANIDIISGGRLVFGLGAGWQENEHEKYGIEFSTLGGRMKRLEEACQVVKGLLGNERASFKGRYYQLDDAPLEPKPVQDPLPLLVGGGGEKVTMRIAATYADEWNVWGTPDVLEHKIGVLEEHCERIGRDPQGIKRSCQAMVVLTDDAAEAEKARGGGRFQQIAGSPAELRETMAAYQEAGVDEFIVPGFNLGEGARRQETLDRFMGEVVPGFR